MHPISLQATTPILELRGASSASLNALHPPPSANPTYGAICCRIFTPAALPEYPAASVRDYCSGAYTEHRTLHEAETALGSIGMCKAAKLGEFICRVVYGAVIGKLLAYFFVG